MIILNKLSIDLNILKIFCLEVQMIFGIGSNNKLYKKFGFLKTTRFFFIFFIKKFIGFENFILRKFKVSFDLKKKISDDIKKKMVRKTYEGVRHKLGLPVRGQRTHSNKKTQRFLTKNTFYKVNLKKRRIKVKVKKLKKK